MRVRTIASTAVVLFVLLLPARSGNALGIPAQPWDTPGYEIDWQVCYTPLDAGYPGVPLHPNYPDPDGGTSSSTCDPGSFAGALPVNTPIQAFTLIRVPRGARNIDRVLTFTPSDGPTEWQHSAVPCGPLDASNECTAGSVTANYLARVDWGCDLVDDVLATSGPGGAPASWPDETLWSPILFTRTSGAGSGPPTAPSYRAAVPLVSQLPLAAPNAFTFLSMDTAAITHVYLGGTAVFALPTPIPIHDLTYESSYTGQPGLEVTTRVVGNPLLPPNDSSANGTLNPIGLCVDTPAHSVTATNDLVTPNANTIIPRWAAITSKLDFRSSDQARILDWECRVIGTGVPDADADCLPDSAEPAGGACVGGINDQDCDNDAVPDGVELHFGSNITQSDFDSDGSPDYDEIFQLTDPVDADSDGDGQLDRQDLLSTNTCTGSITFCPLGTGILDTAQTNDDNCPHTANPTQLNTDSLNEYHGMGVGTGDYGIMNVANGTPWNVIQATPSVHFTNPNEDLEGDACDLDDDNDVLLDVVEPVLEIALWSTSSTSQCVAPGTGFSPSIQPSPVRGDTDNDLVLDGRECEFRSRPDIGDRNLSVCPATIPAVGVVGCAHPGNSLSTPCATAQDPDTDQLCLPRSTGVHTGVEILYRTQNINTGPGVQAHDTDGCGQIGSADNDADQDTLAGACIDPPGAGFFFGLVDGDEILFYGTHPTRIDSDRDGCPDNEEVSDLNGSGAVNAGDSLSLAEVRDHVNNFPNPMDNQPDGVIDDYWMVNYDLNKDGKIDVGDTLALSKAQLSPLANCPSNPASGNGIAEIAVVIPGTTQP